jgi:hypothetical protein
MSSQPPPPPWTWWYENRRPDPRDVRVGDAERSQMADLLSRHYAEGRLDETEFQERLQKAMTAKTHADLSGLAWDLPRVGDPAAQPPAPARRHPAARVLGMCLAAAVVFSLASAAVAGAAWHVPWVVIAIVAFLAWRHYSWGHWHHHHHQHSQSQSVPHP